MKTSKVTMLGFILTVVLFSSLPSAFADGRSRIVTTTSTLASLVRDAMKNDADIYYIASPKQNIHFIQPTPKDVLMVKKAQAFVHQGLDLEVWRDPLLVAAGNSLFLGDAKAAVDVSRGVAMIEIPSSLSREHGDIHEFGNPHYAIDPENARIMMKNIIGGLSGIFPEHAATIAVNAKAWNVKMNQKMKEWNERMKPYEGTAVVTYHRSWPYFANRFGLVVVGEIEPKPGIPPTPKHILELIQIMKEKKSKLIIKEAFNESNVPNRLAKETGAFVVTLDQNMDESRSGVDYFSMMDHNINLIDQALRAFEQKEVL